MPEGRAAWGDLEDRGPRAYAHFGLPMPEERVRLVRGQNQEFVPYVNAGFIAFSDRPNAATGRRFGQDWLETALDFDRNCGIANKRPWLDQISLPLTAARFGYQVRVLNEHFNYSLSRRSDYSKTPDSAILHYHRVRFLVHAPQWPDLRQTLLDTVPAAHRDPIAAWADTVDRATEEADAG